MVKRPYDIETPDDEKGQKTMTLELWVGIGIAIITGPIIMWLVYKDS